MIMMKQVAMYLPSTSKIVSTNQRATRVIQEVVSPEVSKLNRAVMNKKQGDKIRVSREKKL